MVTEILLLKPVYEEAIQLLRRLSELKQQVLDQDLTTFTGMHLMRHSPHLIYYLELKKQLPEWQRVHNSQLAEFEAMQSWLRRWIEEYPLLIEELSKWLTLQATKEQ